MLKKINPTIVIALCTSCVMIVYAFYKRYTPSTIVPTVVFYLVAAVICLLPTLSALLRCRLKKPNMGQLLKYCVLSGIDPYPQAPKRSACNSAF